MNNYEQITVSETIPTYFISRDELKEIMKEAVTTVLTERKDLLEDAVSGAILDMKLGMAMEEADTGLYVPEESILDKLRA